MTPRERARYLRKLAQAKRGGRDVWEHLDANGMLLTGRRFHQVRAKVLHEVADLVEQATAKDIITWYGNDVSRPTVADIQRALVALIRAQAKKEGP